jgi:hypothetical protein
MTPDLFGEPAPPAPPALPANRKVDQAIADNWNPGVVIMLYSPPDEWRRRVDALPADKREEADRLIRDTIQRRAVARRLRAERGAAR